MNLQSYNNLSLIEDGLYLSCLKTVQNEKLIEDLEINAILTVDLFALSNKIVGKYLHIKLQDSFNEDLLSNLNLSNNFLFECYNQNLRVIVHCVAGISRSPAIVIAFLMKKHNLNFDKAYEMVKKKRSIINLNEGFIKQLKLFDEMGLKLDVNYRKYRRLALEQLYFKIKHCFFSFAEKTILNNLNEIFDEYLFNFHENSCLLSPLIIFKCKRCRLYLFNDLNLLETSNNVLRIEDLNNKNCCNSLFVEPLKWMKNLINCLSGILNCKNCFTKLGSYNWNGIDCTYDCSKHKNILPSFKIDLKKVDYHPL